MSDIAEISESEIGDFLILLEHILSTIYSSANERQLSDQLLAEPISAFSVDAGWVQLREPGNEGMRIVNHHGITQYIAKLISQLTSEEELLSGVVLKGEPLVTPNMFSLSKYDSTNPIGAGFRFYAAVPLKTGSEVLGGIGLCGTALKIGLTVNISSSCP